MGYSNYSNKRTIPKITTRKSAPITTNFAKGIYTYKPNDTMDQDEIRLAENARFDIVGEYGTRKGFSHIILPIGHASYSSNMDETFTMRVTSGVEPATFTAASDARICSITIKMRWSAYATDHDTIPRIKLEIGDEAYYSAVNPEDISTNAGDIELFFMDAPDVTAGQTITITPEAQSGSADNAEWATTGEEGETAPLMYTLWSCTPGGIKNVFETRIGGNRGILFVQNNDLYLYGFYTNTIVPIRTLPAGVKNVRFSQNLEEIRYADGKEGPRVVKYTNAWVDNSIPTIDLKTGTNLNISVNNIMNGTADNLVYGAVDPYTEAVWTYPYGYTYAKAPAYSTTATIQGAVGTTLNINISTISPSGIAVGDWITGQGTGTAEVTSISGSTVYLKIVDTTPQTISSYDKFSSDFYQNFPAIKTGDPLTAMFNLGGVLYFMTRRNKYQMYAQTAESWSQSACNAQSGTFSQESLVCDLNYAYYANDKGIYIFDGSSEASLTEKSIQNVYDAIPNKESIVLDLHGNRLYCFYASSGTTNDSCLVYNTNLRVWESFDSNTYVSASCGRQSPSNAFVCGHSRIGLIMFGENEDYADMGTPIAFNLETGYLHFGTTSQLKRITKWRPEFAATERPYTCECGYSLDYTDQVRYAFSIDLQKQIPVMTDYVWDNPSDYGVPAIPTIHTTIPQVNGEFYRCQIRYQHIAAHEPVIFRSHTLTIQTQRIR